MFSPISGRHVVAHPPIIPGDDANATYGDGCDGWLRDWIQHDNLGHRNALFPIEALLIYLNIFKI